MMTDQEQRIAIAQCLGKKNVNIYPAGMPELGIEVPGTSPDYVNDLNAMHEVEKEFEIGPNGYWCTLLEITDRDNGRTMDWRAFAHATARQRAEAFLRVKGLWK